MNLPAPSFFARIWVDIVDFFTVSERVVLIFSSSLIHSIAQNGGDILIQAAKTAVDAAEAAGGSGSEKREAAKASIIESLKANGIPLVMNSINGAIEAAVAELNNEAVLVDK